MTSKSTLPVHVTGMKNIKGQQAINTILDNINNEIDNHKWVVTTQDYAELKFEKYLESGSTLTVDQKPKANIPVIGTHNNRKVYIGDLDIQGNIVVKDLILRDNVSTISKSWEVRGANTTTGTLIGSWWNSETFGVGVREPKELTEVASVPNDIRDPVYGSTIYNTETNTITGTALDTKTFEKVEKLYFIQYPYVNRDIFQEDTQYSLDYWISLGRRNIGNQTYFPQITTTNAMSVWSPMQKYGLFTWENGSPGYLKMHEHRSFSNYNDFYNWVARYPSTNGATGTGVMIPSWQFVNTFSGRNTNCAALYVPLTTRRFISEEYDKRNSGIVKVDMVFRI